MSVKDNSFGIADIQDKMLGSLKCLIQLCDENQLTYWAAGGTCIGALRHDGFIPWDDDVDVFMPRADYEKLWELYSGKEIKNHYKLCRTTEDYNQHHRAMRLVDIDTTFIVKRSIDEDIDHGVYIDILPLDGCPSNHFQRLNQIVNCMLFSVYNVQCLPEFHGGKVFRGVVTFLLNLHKDVESRNKIWKRCEKRMKKYSFDKCNKVVELTTNTKALMHPYPKEWFSGTIYHKFEDIDVALPIGVDNYLSSFFGDYMQFPDKSEQCPRHKTIYVNMNESYKKYKGIYYCRKGAVDNE
jgi:lipopolysaccharide cholinephosphotransferase